MRNPDHAPHLAKLRQAVDHASDTARRSSAPPRLVALLSQTRVVSGGPLSSPSAPYEIMIPSIGTSGACLLHVELSALTLSVAVLAHRITEEAREHMQMQSRKLRERVLGKGSDVAEDREGAGQVEEEVLDESD